MDPRIQAADIIGWAWWAYQLKMESMLVSWHVAKDWEKMEMFSSEKFLWMLSWSKQQSRYEIREKQDTEESVSKKKDDNSVIINAEMEVESYNATSERSLLGRPSVDPVSYEKPQAPEIPPLQVEQLISHDEETSMIVNEEVQENKLFSDDKPSQKSVIINEESDEKTFADQLNGLDISHFSEEEEGEDKQPDLSSMRMVFGSEATLWEHCEKAIEMGALDEPLELNEDAFNWRSFQDFSLKKFTELLQDDKLPDMYKQNTFRDHIPK